MATATLAETAATNANIAVNTRRAPNVIRRGLVMIAGAMILAAGPAIGKSGLHFALQGFPLTNEASGALGSSLAFIVGPSIVIAIIATLSGRSLWQRVILFLPAFAMQAGVYVAIWCYGGSVQRAFAFLWTCPLLLVAAALPAFLFRLWRRWILVPAGDDGRPRVSSIASLMWVTTLWAAAAACTQRVDTQAWFSIQDEHGRGTEIFALIIMLVLPALFVGTALVLALRTVMIQRMAMAVSTTIGVSALFVTIAAGVVVWLATFGNEPPTANGLFNTAIGVSCFCLTTLAIGVVSFGSLRAIGCRFLHGRSLVKSA